MILAMEVYRCDCGTRKRIFPATLTTYHMDSNPKCSSMQDSPLDEVSVIVYKLSDEVLGIRFEVRSGYDLRGSEFIPTSRVLGFWERVFCHRELSPLCDSDEDPRAYTIHQEDASISITKSALASEPGELYQRYPTSH